MSDEPISLPDEETSPDEGVITIKQTTFFYFLTGAVFLVIGFILAWITFSTTSGNISSAEIRGVVAEAVRAEVASLQNSIASIARAAPAQATQAPIVPVSVELGNSVGWGPTDAAVTIVEFSDFQCPYCARFFAQTYPLLRQEYGDRVRFVYKHFPLSSIHPDAEAAAVASECAREQDKFWEYHDALYENQGDLSRAALIRYAANVGVANNDQFTTCLDSGKYLEQVQADFNQGLALGINGTPTFFINGLPLVGAHPYSTFKSAVEQAIAQAGS